MADPAPIAARPRGWSGGRAWLGAAGALVLSLAATALALAVGGYAPTVAGAALVRGALGSPDALLSVTLVRSVPLVLTGLAVALAFRAGVWNIGAEGQLYVGAICATIAGLAGPSLPALVHLPLVLLAAAAGGALWAAVPAWMRIRLGVGEVITTLLLNFVAIDLAAWAVHGPLQERRRVFPQSDPIAAGARLPALWSGTRLHWGFVLAVALALVLWWVLSRSLWGFRVRAAGASPDAARVSGRIAVSSITFSAFLWSGALAGLAGGVEVAGVTYALYEGISPGHGYTAIAVALLAGLHPLAVVGAAVFFGGLEGGAGAMQRFAGVPAAWVGAVEALVILSVLALDRGVRRVRIERDGDPEPGGPAADVPAADALAGGAL
jgi:simple sugar transport system permease protein